MDSLVTAALWWEDGGMPVNRAAGNEQGGLGGCVVRPTGAGGLPARVCPGAPGTVTRVCLSPEPPQVQQKHFLPSWRIWKLFFPPPPQPRPIPNHPQSSSAPEGRELGPTAAETPRYTHTPHAGVGVWHRTPGAPVSGQVAPQRLPGGPPRAPFQLVPREPFLCVPPSLSFLF